jgi:hypothetical protein
VEILADRNCRDVDVDFSGREDWTPGIGEGDKRLSTFNLVNVELALENRPASISKFEEPDVALFDGPAVLTESRLLSAS